MGFYDDFNGGLWVKGPRDKTPSTALRRARGVGPIKRASIRSRDGSTKVFDTLVGATPTTAHSLTKFAGVRFAGVGTELQRNNIQLITGLNGNRLAFVKMPPSATVTQDFLFVAGGGLMRKVDFQGGVTKWGIDAPADGMTAAAGVAGNPNGSYKYRVTFRNSVTGNRSNPNPTDVSVTVTNQSIDLSSIPTSADSQVDSREIWRTVASGTVFFRLTIINDNTTTTFNDDVADADLETLELPLDNDEPPDTISDVAGPHQGRMWFLNRATITDAGSILKEDGAFLLKEDGAQLLLETGGAEQHRLYFSPIARPESFASFINVGSNEDPGQKLVIWAGQLWLFAQSKIFLIIGTDEPFLSREVFGAPGTIKPFTVKVTPWGIMYEANDGMRLFNGSFSKLIGNVPIEPLMRGEGAENLGPFEGVVAEYARGEYIISDTVQTLAMNIQTETWRDLGIGVNAFDYEDDLNEIIAAFSNKILMLEKEGVLSDDGSPILFETETPAERISYTQQGLSGLIVIEANTGGQALTPTLVHDNGSTSFSTISSTNRTRFEIPTNLNGEVFGVRLSGSLSGKAEVFSMGVEVYKGA